MGNYAMAARLLEDWKARAEKAEARVRELEADATAALEAMSPHTLLFRLSDDERERIVTNAIERFMHEPDPAPPPMPEGCSRDDLPDGTFRVNCPQGWVSYDASIPLWGINGIFDEREMPYLIHALEESLEVKP